MGESWDDLGTHNVETEKTSRPTISTDCGGTGNCNISDYVDEGKEGTQISRMRWATRDTYSSDDEHEKTEPSAKRVVKTVDEM